MNFAVLELFVGGKKIYVKMFLEEPFILEMLWCFLCFPLYGHLAASSFYC